MIINDLKAAVYWTRKASCKMHVMDSIIYNFSTRVQSSHNLSNWNAYKPTSTTTAHTREALYVYIVYQCFIDAHNSMSL
jgi:hypothetical protein